MLSWLKRNKRQVDLNETVKQVIKPLDYHPKVILAWAKAIEGNDELRSWLRLNHEELFYAVFAILLEDEARNWLEKNGYVHLLAFINAAEGNESAQKWLLVHGMEVLYHMALAVEDEQSSWVWLRTHVTEDIFILTRSIKSVKDQIEENHNDIHSFRKDA